MKIIDDIQAIDQSQWKELNNSSQTGNVFQTKEWYDFCNCQPLFEAFFYALFNDRNKIRGVVVGYIQKDGGILKQFLSRRAIIQGGPLLADDILNKELDLLLKYVAKSLRGKAIYIETRNFNDYSKYKDIFNLNGFNYIPHLNFHIDTTNIDVVNKNLHRNKRRQIKASEKEGVFIDSTPTIDDVKVFYALLRNMYRTKVKTPLPPISYFESLYETHFAKFLLVKKENEIIGGLVILVQNNKTVYQLFLCGLDGKYSGIYPSVMGTYAGLQFAAEHNCPRCDLMGAGKPDEDYGVRDFKAGFGGNLVEHGRYCMILNSFLYRIGFWGVKILKRIK